MKKDTINPLKKKKRKNRRSNRKIMIKEASLLPYMRESRHLCMRRVVPATQLIGSGVEPIKVMKVYGWKDLKTMSYYLRLSGMDEKGVTEGLNFLPNIGGSVVAISKFNPTSWLSYRYLE